MKPNHLLFYLISTSTHMPYQYHARYTQGSWDDVASTLQSGLEGAGGGDPIAAAQSALGGLTDDVQVTLGCLFCSNPYTLLWYCPREPVSFIYHSILSSRYVQCQHDILTDHARIAACPCNLMHFLRSHQDLLLHDRHKRLW